MDKTILAESGNENVGNQFVILEHSEAQLAGCLFPMLGIQEAVAQIHYCHAGALSTLDIYRGRVGRLKGGLSRAPYEWWAIRVTLSDIILVLFQGMGSTVIFYSRQNTVYPAGPITEVVKPAVDLFHPLAGVMRGKREGSVRLGRFVERRRFTGRQRISRIRHASPPLQKGKVASPPVAANRRGQLFWTVY
jgi:hypothetical protein